MVFFLSFGFLGSILFRGMSWIILKASFFQFITFTLAVVIDAGDLLLVAAHMLAHHLVEVVILVGILFTLSWTALLQQVAKLHRLDVYIFIYIFSLFERMQ